MTNKISIYDLKKHIEKIKEKVGIKEFTVNDIYPLFPEYSILRIAHFLRKAQNYRLIEKTNKLKVRNSNKSDKKNAYRYINKYQISNKGD